MRGIEASDGVPDAALRGGVLSLDLATRTGWAMTRAEHARAWPRSRPFSGLALVPPEPRPPAEFGTLMTGKPGSTHGERAAALVTWLDKVQADHRPGVIVIEQPMPAKFSKNLAATQIAIGLSMVVQSHAHRHGCLFREIPIISAKAWFGSKMSKDKAPMMACARALGWAVATDHEADALAILDLFLARMMAARAMGRRAA
jgi:Holliday junction resolvasome RuvABC endonuclease subunit